MRIIIDGNDGTGKTTLIKELQKITNDEILDRGLPSELTEKDNIEDSLPENKDENLYFILTCPEKVCQNRLKERGADLTVQYHTLNDLIHYRSKFFDVFTTMMIHGYAVYLINANRPLQKVKREVEAIINFYTDEA